jgi:hypothetical protein
MIATVVVCLFGVLLLAPQIGRGEDASQALAEYSPYMPGNAVPHNLTCNSVSGYDEELQLMCRVPGGTFCQHGYIMVDDGIITQTSFFKCHFPLAYLIAQYGRYEQVQHFSRVVILRWPDMYAHVRRDGRFYAMQPVHIISWWQPRPTNIDAVGSA